MDLQTIYNNLQADIKNKVAQIESKQAEIKTLETDIYKLQGATEMLVVISKQMEQDKTADETNGQDTPQVVTPVEPVVEPTQPAEDTTQPTEDETKDQTTEQVVQLEAGFVPVQ